METVGAVDQFHFTRVDVPLLAQFSAASELAERAQAALDEHGAVSEAGKTSPWLTVLEKSTRACVALAARLRICPQSRFDRLVAGTSSRPLPYPYPAVTAEVRRRPLPNTGTADDFF